MGSSLQQHDGSSGGNSHRITSVPETPPPPSGRRHTLPDNTKLEIEQEVYVDQEKPGWRNFLFYVGPGFLVSLAYLDPGNLETDLQAGANHGYELLWVILIGLIFALIIQSLAANLGVSTGKHLSELCKAEYPIIVKYCLWILAEIAVIAADIPEVIGTAFALNILFEVPVWVGVICTGFSTLLLLGLQRYGVRKLELLIAILVLVMAACFFGELSYVKPPAKQVIKGMFIPKLSGQGAIGDAIALLGALVMPHNLFLHSALVLSRKIPSSVRGINMPMERGCGGAWMGSGDYQPLMSYAMRSGASEAPPSTIVTPDPPHPVSDSALRCYNPAIVGSSISTTPQPPVLKTRASPNDACRYYLIESGFALFIAFLINVAVISVSGTVCSGNNLSENIKNNCHDITLNSASFLLKNVLGKSSSTVYAIALLASGQSSTITGTYAGQFIMQGFLDLKMRKWLRNLITRCIAITPSLIVSIIGGSSGAGRLIIIASMILSFELPFALIPLLKFSSSSTKMGPHKNSIYIIVVSWILGLGIIGINIYYLSTGFVGWLIHNNLPRVGNIFIGIIVFPLMAIYVLSVVYLMFRKDKVITFIEPTKLDPAHMENGNGDGVALQQVPYREDLADIPLPR
ncbi:hypothetical protein CASFOL_016755 [Castilleja foliolosa]|uniref:Uncharacterized protein n=1 Tax=Castilleja foliolosa TaxID=1961234 RepID=A0ABD3D947_9LAMI